MLRQVVLRQGLDGRRSVQIQVARPQDLAGDVVQPPSEVGQPILQVHHQLHVDRWPRDKGSARQLTGFDRI